MSTGFGCEPRYSSYSDHSPAWPSDSAPASTPTLTLPPAQSFDKVDPSVGRLENALKDFVRDSNNTSNGTPPSADLAHPHCLPVPTMLFSSRAKLHGSTSCHASYQTSGKSKNPVTHITALGDEKLGWACSCLRTSRPAPPNAITKSYKVLADAFSAISIIGTFSSAVILAFLSLVCSIFGGKLDTARGGFSGGFIAFACTLGAANIAAANAVICSNLTIGTGADIRLFHIRLWLCIALLLLSGGISTWSLLALVGLWDMRVAWVMAIIYGSCCLLGVVDISLGWRRLRHWQAENVG